MSYFESFLPQVGPVPFTADGQTNGYVTITSTAGFYVNQNVTITSATKVGNYEVKEIISGTQMRVGLSTKNNHDSVAAGSPFNYNLPGANGPASDMSGFTLSDNSYIFAPKQPRPLRNDSLSMAYMAEPIVAHRVYNVGTPASFQYARVAAASVTSGNATVTSTFPVMTLARDTRLISVLSSLNADCSITLNGVETFRLESGDKFLLDLGSDSFYMAAGTVIGIFQNGSVPTSGSIRITAIG